METSDDVAKQPPRTVDGVVIHAAQKHWALGESGPLLIVVWRGSVTEEALRVVNDRLWDITQRQPGKCSFVTIIERNSPAPSAPLRKIAMEGISRLGKSLNNKVVVIEGNELRNALTRAVLTGMVLLRPETQPTKFFKDTRQMSGWLKGQLADVPNLDQEVVRAVEVIRNEMPK